MSTNFIPSFTLFFILINFYVFYDGTQVQFFSHYNTETYLFIYQFVQIHVSKKPLIGKHSYLRSYDRYNADLYLVYNVVDAIVLATQTVSHQILVIMKYFLSYDVASGGKITPCNKID